jgi:Flagellar basal body rod protein
MNLNSILSINRTGLNGLQNNLDNVSHNIANANTVGYKGIINSFNELMNNNLTNSDGALGNSNARVDSNTGLNAREHESMIKSENLKRPVVHLIWLLTAMLFLGSLVPMVIHT